MMPYLKKNTMAFIYKLLTVAILMSTKILEEENSLYCILYYVSTCDVDRTYNYNLNMPW